MKEPPDNDLKNLLEKYAPLAQLAGLYFIWQENKKTEQKISPWSRWERFLLPAMIVIALGFIFKDMPETMGEIKDTLVLQNDRILIIETKIGEITTDLAEIKSNVRRYRESLSLSTQDRFTGVEAESLENRMRLHTDSANADLIDRVERTEQRLNLRMESIEHNKRRLP